MNTYNGFTATMRMKAYRWLMAEYAAGRRQKPYRCDVCLQTAGHIEPHSENYSPPYGEHIGRYGLCYRCHMILHCRFRQPDAFQHYRDTLAQGVRFEAIEGRNFPRFRREHGITCTAPTEEIGEIPPGFGTLLEEGEAVLAGRQPRLF